MEEKMITMSDGKKIYARVYENGHKNTLLYLHGGPGQSCNTFQYQAKLLSSYMNVILIDQRGVLRSDKIKENDMCTVDTLINDCEDLRKALRIEKWSVLGHSFGGFLALLYADKYPENIEKIVLESSGTSLLTAIRNIYTNGIRVLRDKNLEEAARELEYLMSNTNNITKLVSEWGNVPEHIRSEVYFNKPWSKMPKEEQKMNYVDNVTDEQWQNSLVHVEKVMLDSKINEDVSLIIKELKCPSLLIRGEFDPCLNDENQAFCINNAHNGQVAFVKECAFCSLR
jgi:proline iminopeptidase